MVAAGKTLAQIAQAAATGLVGLPAAYAITYAHGNAGTLMQALVDFGHHAAEGAVKYVEMHPSHVAAIAALGSGGLLDIPGVGMLTVLGSVDFTPILKTAEQLMKLTEQLGHETIEYIKENPIQTAVIIAGVICIINPGGVAVPLLRVAGFGDGGVIASSIAAGIQSSIGNINAGSLFALLQSAGARGAGAAAVVNGAVTGIGATMVALGKGKDWLASKL